MKKEEIIQALERSEMAEQVTLPIEKWREVLMQLTQQDNKIICQEQQLKDNTQKICKKIKAYDTNTNKQKVGYTEYVIGLVKLLSEIEKGDKE